jgi:hypothetical protein
MTDVSSLKTSVAAWQTLVAEVTRLGLQVLKPTATALGPLLSTTIVVRSQRLKLPLSVDEKN